MKKTALYIQSIAFKSIVFISLMFVLNLNAHAYDIQSRDMVLIAEANADNNKMVSVGFFAYSPSSQAYINWGDGESSTIAATEGFGIDAPSISEHTYANDGTYTIAINANSGSPRISMNGPFGSNTSFKKLTQFGTDIFVGAFAFSRSTELVIDATDILTKVHPPYGMPSAFMDIKEIKSVTGWEHAGSTC